MKNKNIKSKNGFTLIEILVAMTIVAVLVSISLVSLQGARKVARDGKRKADLEQIRSALEIYRSEVKTYPGSVNFGGSLESSGNVYLDLVPNDPLSGIYTYVYTQNSSNSYTLCSYLETSSSPQVCGDCIIGTSNSCYYKVTNH